MGDSLIFDEEKDEFFDSKEDNLSSYSSLPSSPGHHELDSDLCPAEDFISWVPGNPRSGYWGVLSSVQERQITFMKWLNTNWPNDKSPDSFDPEISDYLKTGVVTNKILDEEIGPSTSCYCGADQHSKRDEILVENGYMMKNLDQDTISIADDLGNGRSLTSHREARSNRRAAIDEFQRGFSPSSSIQYPIVSKDDTSGSSKKTSRGRKRIGWLRRLGFAACVTGGNEDSDLTHSNSDWVGSINVQRVTVRPSKKRAKEFSALYTCQDIKAHEGAILTLKFSPDGYYLASGGDDSLVYVWGVTENVRMEEVDVPKDDPSCMFFIMDHNSKLVPLYNYDKGKEDGLRSMRRKSETACVIIPANTFRLLKKPLHVFRGHDGDVLDLSWSKDKYLLSSSTDKTVRLWRVGSDICLKVFSHNNYVTCIQFNPVDEKYFISGSIDGKVRVWEVPRCRVVDWIDVKQIVTAVCYRSDGKGVVVGFMSGDCHFYDLTDNRLVLDTQISLRGKKKSPCKRITSIQITPDDPRKLMVTSADSRIQILDGVDVIRKYKGLGSGGSCSPASFTSNGSHIISVMLDSHVHIWRHRGQGSPTSKVAKSTRTCERFFCSNVSVAVPWHGFNPGSPLPTESEIQQSRSANKTRVDSPGNRPIGRFFLDILPKGTATWPEERLLLSSAIASPLGKSHYKFLKNSCQGTDHAWGQVIVTAGWDGRIRLFRNYGLPVRI